MIIATNYVKMEASGEKLTFEKPSNGFFVIMILIKENGSSLPENARLFSKNIVN